MCVTVTPGNKYPSLTPVCHHTPSSFRPTGDSCGPNGPGEAVGHPSLTQIDQPGGAGYYPLHLWRHACGQRLPNQAVLCHWGCYIPGDVHYHNNLLAYLRRKYPCPNQNDVELYWGQTSVI